MKENYDYLETWLRLECLTNRDDFEEICNSRVDFELERKKEIERRICEEPEEKKMAREFVSIDKIMKDNIKRFDLDVEHWNKVRYTLREILEEYYIDTIAKERNLEYEIKEYENELVEKQEAVRKNNKSNNDVMVDWKNRKKYRNEKKLEYLFKNDMHGDSHIDNFIQGREDTLFKILKIFIKDRKKLHNGNKRNYSFNLRNYYFIYTILDLYDSKEKNCRNLYKGRYYEIEEEFMVFLYEGLLDLAKNEDTNLEVEEAIRGWNNVFNPFYKEICSIVEDLKANVFYYVGAVPENETNEKLFDEIKKKLLDMNMEIIKMTEDKMEFPELDFKEMREYMDKQREARQKRSEKAKQGWKQRKDKMCQ